MNFSTTFFINSGGLFDFDLTFVLEVTLFILLAIVVTFSFISPLSAQINERAEFIDYNLRKSTILLTLGYEKLSNCVLILTEENNEINRQLKLVQTLAKKQLEEEILIAQKENLNLLRKLKGNFAIKSAVLFEKMNPQMDELAEIFFSKKFQMK